MKILYTKKQKQYRKYIEKHRYYVSYAFNRFINHTFLYDQLPNVDLFNLEQRIRVHDMSKFDKEEFYPYCQYFYPEEDHFPSKNIMLQGWIHHYSYNDHHPEFWIIDRDIYAQHICNENFTGLKSKDMPIEAILEMFSDWLAMSLINHSSLRDWYNKEGIKLPFSYKTQQLVKQIMNILYQKSNLDILLTTLQVPDKN